MSKRANLKQRRERAIARLTSEINKMKRMGVGKSQSANILKRLRDYEAIVEETKNNLELHPNQKRKIWLHKHSHQPAAKKRNSFTVHDALDEATFSDRIDEMTHKDFFGN